MDTTGNSGALLGASNKKGFFKNNPTERSPKTILVHPFSNTSENRKHTENKDNNPRTYLLETPKDLKRKTPLLEIPSDHNKRPKLFKNYPLLNKNTTKINSEKTQDASSAALNCSISNDELKSDMKSAANKQSDSCQNRTRSCQHHCCCKIERNCRCESKSNGCVNSDLSDCVKVEDVSKCCGCQGQGQPVKVIFAPAMLPGMQSIFGPVPGIPYVVKPTQKINEQVCYFFCSSTDHYYS